MTTAEILFLLAYMRQFNPSCKRAIDIGEGMGCISDYERGGTWKKLTAALSPQKTDCVGPLPQWVVRSVNLASGMADLG